MNSLNVQLIDMLGSGKKKYIYILREKAFVFNIQLLVPKNYPLPICCRFKLHKNSNSLQYGVWESQ